MSLGKARAPLPRAWQGLDGSAFQRHGDLMAMVLGMEKKATDVVFPKWGRG